EGAADASGRAASEVDRHRAGQGRVVQGVAAAGSAAAVDAARDRAAAGELEGVSRAATLQVSVAGEGQADVALAVVVGVGGADGPAVGGVLAGQRVGAAAAERVGAAEAGGDAGVAAGVAVGRRAGQGDAAAEVQGVGAGAAVDGAGQG